jgi:hypothetical protein
MSFLPTAMSGVLKSEPGSAGSTACSHQVSTASSMAGSAARGGINCFRNVLLPPRLEGIFKCMMLSGSEEHAGCERSIAAFACSCLSIKGCSLFASSSSLLLRQKGVARLRISFSAVAAASAASLSLSCPGQCVGTPPIQKPR